MGDTGKVSSRNTQSKENPRPTKRPRKQHYDVEDLSNLENDDADDFSTGSIPQERKDTGINPNLLEHAKSRLSKWAARLFDPDRPRGLVQTPETIPLNDEYLKAFGQRVRQEDSKDPQKAAILQESSDGDADDDLYDDVASDIQAKAAGTKIKVDGLDYFLTTVKTLRGACEQFGPLLDIELPMVENDSKRNTGKAYVVFQQEDDAHDCIDNLKEVDGRLVKLSIVSQNGKSSKEQQPTSKDDRTKVKISNLAFITDEKLLRVACEKYGPLVEVNLIMDRNNDALNAGRAYVTFEDEDDAQECIEKLKELGGRRLRLALASEKTSNTGTNTANSRIRKQSMLNQFADKDISTICFRCGKVGHYEANCMNPAKPKPCALCGSIEHQDRRCDQRMICFNCGCPGHSVRECPERRGLPRRLICSVCFESGHHRNSCRNYRGSGNAQSRDATCMHCGQQGHFLCKNLEWFFGLKGIFCFNCGHEGHSGFQCQRPNVFQCREEPVVGEREIERANTESVAEQLQTQAPSRGRQIDRSNLSSGRHRSMPPQQQRQGGSRTREEKPKQNFSRRGYR